MQPVSGIILVVCMSVFLLQAVEMRHKLPERMASQFDQSGNASGWMARSTFITTMLGVGFGIPLFVMCVMGAVRFLPPKYLNVPNPTYWREPQNFKKGCEFLFVSSMWFASGFFLWQAGFVRLIVEANRLSPPLLNNFQVFVLSGLLLFFSLAWVAVLSIRFLRTS